jgi:hypothetical protein
VTAIETIAGASWRSRFGYRVGAALVLSVLLNVVLVGIATAAGVAPGFRPIAAVPVAFLSAVGVVGAAGTYLVLDRFSDDPGRLFRVLAIVVLVLSFVPDVLLLSADPAATVPGVVVLMIMHVVVAAACLSLLPDGR